jgi:uncharacterized protein YqhQ
MLPVLESGEETLVGGQAVMEGVMMRAPHSYCVAVRRPDGEIVTEQMPVARMSEKYRFFKWPVLRGLGVLGQAMSLGIKALKFSTNVGIQAIRGESKETQPISNTALMANLLFSLAFFIFLYKFVPLYAATSIGNHVAALHNHFAVNIVDGLIRIVIFLAFLTLLSRSKDIHRVFEYHGAEHKVVFNFESGDPVTVENAQSFTTWHPRCGTSFLLVVMVISMLVYMAVPFDGFAARFISRIVLLPLIVGVSYELIRFAAKKRGSFLAWITAPGLWLQRVTTQPPSDGQTEVAIHALDRAMMLEREQGGELIIA